MFIHLTSRDSRLRSYVRTRMYSVSLELLNLRVPFPCETWCSIVISLLHLRFRRRNSQHVCRLSLVRASRCSMILVVAEAAVTGAIRDEGAVAVEAVPGAGTGNLLRDFLATGPALLRPCARAHAGNSRSLSWGWLYFWCTLSRTGGYTGCSTRIIFPSRKKTWSWTRRP